VHPDKSPALPGARRLVAGAPSLVTGAPSYSEGRQECPPRVLYSPEIDASKFTLHILSDTPGGFQCLKYILLMKTRSFVEDIITCSKEVSKEIVSDMAEEMRKVGNLTRESIDNTDTVQQIAGS
jgi:hypothetical protein